MAISRRAMLTGTAMLAVTLRAERTRAAAGKPEVVVYKKPS